MFYLCSHAIRSKVKERAMDMIRVVAAGFALALTSPGNAQEFQIFGHSLAQEQEPGAQPAGDLQAPTYAGVVGSAPPTGASSFKEALYEPLIRQAEVRYRLPPRLLQALAWQESRFNPMAISSAGAAGLAQLMPGTARELGVTNRHDPAQSIDGGARYLKQMLDRFGAIHLALAAYNAGPGAVARASGIPKNRETPDYVTSIIARWMAYSRP
jgi:soluble lytic murein transglycosylase-like protein